MADHSTMTVVGRLVRDPELKYTPNGKAVVEGSVAVNRRVKNKQTGEWEDGDASFYDFSIWNQYAENVAESLRKGDIVIVLGRMEQRTYEKDGQTRKFYEIKADQVAPSLQFAKANLDRGDRGGSRPQPQRQPATVGGGDIPTAKDDVPF